MAKKNPLLIAVIAVLAVIYVIYFTDWLKPKTVGIFHTNRSLHSRQPRGGALPSLIFGMDRSLRLTEVKVVSCAELQTNKNPLPLWHLVTISNSVPLKQFHYGQFIGGMTPLVPGEHAQALETNVTYRLLVTAGKIKGEHDFMLK